MFDYIKNVLDKSQEEFCRRSETPVANHLFYVDKKIEKLNKEDGSLFNHMLAKLMYLYKKERPYIQRAVSFLCTLVQEPDIYYWKKLQRTIRYLKTILWLPLTMEDDGTMIIKWWIDIAYVVHKEYWVHTRFTISLGKGHQYSTSSKQKLKTQSSTESELVGIDDLGAIVQRSTGSWMSLTTDHWTL